MVQANSDTTFTATWRHLTPTMTNDCDARSSHGVLVVGDWVMVYGGEAEARVPFDDEIRAYKGD